MRNSCDHVCIFCGPTDRPIKLLVPAKKKKKKIILTMTKTKNGKVFLFVQTGAVRDAVSLYDISVVSEL